MQNERSVAWSELRTSSILPERRSYHTACALGGVMYIYGGYDIKEGDRGNLYFVNVEDDEPKWVRPTLKGDVPTGLSRHSAVVYEKRLYFLGGESSSSQSRAFFYIDLGTF